MADVVPAFEPETTVLTLQNGFRNPEIVADYVPEERIVAGVTEASADLEEPGHITHTGTGVTTMLQDVEAGHRTEIDFLNGAVVEFAEEHGTAVPINRTLARLVRLAEEQKG